MTTARLLNDGVWVCPVCGREFAKMSALRGHLTREARKERQAHDASPATDAAVFFPPHLVPARTEHFQRRAVTV